MLKRLFSCLLFCLFSICILAHENNISGKGHASKKSAKSSTVKKMNLPGKKKSGKSSKIKRKSLKAGKKKRSVNRPRKATHSSKLYGLNGAKEMEEDGFSRNKGMFNWPLEEGTVKTGFGPYKVGYGEIMGNNPGLTLETEQGSLVQSVFEGVVTDLFQMEGKWGVTIQHGNYFTVYSNLSSVIVSEDDKIESGAVIGKAACNKDGNAELEFLLLKKNKNIDPQPWMKKNQ